MIATTRPDYGLSQSDRFEHPAREFLTPVETEDRRELASLRTKLARFLMELDGIEFLCATKFQDGGAVFAFASVDGPQFELELRRAD